MQKVVLLVFLLASSASAFGQHIFGKNEIRNFLNKASDGIVEFSHINNTSSFNLDSARIGYFAEKISPINFYIIHCDTLNLDTYHFHSLNNSRYYSYSGKMRIGGKRLGIKIHEIQYLGNAYPWNSESLFISSYECFTGAHITSVFFIPLKVRNGLILFLEIKRKDIEDAKSNLLYKLYLPK